MSSYDDWKTDPEFDGKVSTSHMGKHELMANIEELECDLNEMRSMKDRMREQLNEETEKLNDALEEIQRLQGQIVWWYNELTEQTLWVPTFEDLDNEYVEMGGVIS